MPSRLAAPVVALLLVALSACTQSRVEDRPADVHDGTGRDPGQEATASVHPPRLGACRSLAPGDLAASSNTGPTVDCTDPHTAQTFAVGTFPARLTEGARTPDRRLGAYVYHRCTKRFRAFLGSDDSLALRTVLTWAWFRPPEQAWQQGARWYRCDVVGGSARSAHFASLPETAKGLLLGTPDDRWMVCARGATVSGSVKLPCSRRHTWRAVTTIKLGGAKDPYPGDRLVQVRTRDYCSDSVGAWLHYPVGYDYGYTWFHRAEWKAGNRRSICWAKTAQ